MTITDSCVSCASTAALKKDRENMGKRYIVVKPASRLEYYEAAAARLDGERQSHLQPSHGYSVIKMRGLPFNVTYEDIILFFSGTTRSLNDLSLSLSLSDTC
jgi:hypothetical protein